MSVATLRRASKSVKRPASKPRSYWNQVRAKCLAGMIPAFAYYRMSSDEQDKSVPDQREAVSAWAAKNNYCILWEYIDEGISGDETHKRIAFKRLVEDATNGKFRAVVSWDQDRFGRFDLLEAGWWVKPLRDARVHLATVGQGVFDWDSSTGRLMFGIQAEAKHQFLQDLSRNSTRGRISKAHLGEWSGGKTPLGYIKDTTTNKLALGPSDEVAAVVSIFAMYDIGMSLRSITDTLNKKGPHPRTGQYWSFTTVRGILTNPRYTGDYVWPLNSRGRYYCVKDGEVSKELGDVGTQIVVPNNHPAVVDRKLFDRVNDKLAASKRMTAPARNGGPYFLKGLLYCADCGMQMRARTHTIRGKTYTYYVCSGHTNRGASFCASNNVPQDELVDEVVKALEDWASDPNFHDRFDTLAREQVDKVSDSGRAESLRKRKQEIKKQLSNAKRRMTEVDDELFAILKEQIKDLLAEEKQVDHDLDVLGQPPNSIADQRRGKLEEVRARIRDTSRVVASAPPHEIRAHLLDFIDRIDVKVDRVQTGARFRYELAEGVVHLHKSLAHLTSHDEALIAQNPRENEAENLYGTWVDA